MKYEIDITDYSNDLFERESDNVITVVVYDQQQKNISQDSQVMLFLSRNALLGLGTELIRLAHNYREEKHFHLEPATKETLAQRLGVFVRPDSAEMIVVCEDSKCIDEYLG